MAKKEEQKEFHVDVSKFVEQAKKNFNKLTSDAGKLAKQGEKEIVKASNIGKIQLLIP